LKPTTDEECGGEGKCPARKAGPRPSKIHVLCACNQTWLLDDELMPLVAFHGYDHCEKDETHPQGVVWA
jgi:hypothetical protein